MLWHFHEFARSALLSSSISSVPAMDKLCQTRHLDLNFQLFCICRDKRRVGPAESSRFFDTILEVLVVNVKASPPEFNKRSNQQQRIAPPRQGFERNEEFRRTTWHHAASKFHQSLLDRARKRERETEIMEPRRQADGIRAFTLSSTST